MPCGLFPASTKRNFLIEVFIDVIDGMTLSHAINVD